jgi:hypothetical protein
MNVNGILHAVLRLQGDVSPLRGQFAESFSCDLLRALLQVLIFSFFVDFV